MLREAEYTQSMTAPPLSTASIRDRVRLAKAASRELARLSTAVKNAALLRTAELLETEQEPVLEANAVDVRAGTEAGVDAYFLERLTLSPERLLAIASDTRNVVSLPDPVGEIIDGRTLANGMHVVRRRVPLGVIASIYESRPNVTVDIAALALKSGNASVLRGGKEAQHTNRALGELLHRALEETGVPGDAVQVLSDPDRAHVDELLKMDDLIDMVVPRGGEALIDHVRRNATMPVVAHGAAVVHIYVDSAANLDKAIDVVDNAKTRRYSICNAVDTVLVHSAIAPAFLERLADRWAGRVTVAAGTRALALMAPHREKGVEVEAASDDDWEREQLALRASVTLVDSVDEAIEHIERHGSHHSDAILTEDYTVGTQFLDEVDSAAVYWNASTQFTDGAQFGLGAEVGISTQKTHARGPMGLRELTSYKWVVTGNGQVRPL